MLHAFWDGCRAAGRTVRRVAQDPTRAEQLAYRAHAELLAHLADRADHARFAAPTLKHLACRAASITRISPRRPRRARPSRHACRRPASTVLPPEENTILRLMPNKPISLRAPRADERPELGPSSLDALYQDQERRVAMSKGC